MLVARGRVDVEQILKQFGQDNNNNNNNKDKETTKSPEVPESKMLRLSLCTEAS